MALSLFYWRARRDSNSRPLGSKEEEISENIIQLACIASEAITLAEAPKIAIPQLDDGHRARMSLKRQKNDG
jgi:hypothetical protein